MSWYWKTDLVARDDDQKAWTAYGAEDSDKIEKAYQQAMTNKQKVRRAAAKKRSAGSVFELNKTYSINFDSMVQFQTKDTKRQRPIKRVEKEQPSTSSASSSSSLEMSSATRRKLDSSSSKDDQPPLKMARRRSSISYARANNEPFTLLTLPEDALDEILDFLPLTDLATFSLLSKKANELANTSYTWSSRTHRTVHKAIELWPTSFANRNLHFEEDLSSGRRDGWKAIFKDLVLPLYKCVRDFLKLQEGWNNEQHEIYKKLDWRLTAEIDAEELEQDEFKDKLPIGVSKIGGLPDLPKGDNDDAKEDEEEDEGSDNDDEDEGDNDSDGDNNDDEDDDEGDDKKKKTKKTKNKYRWPKVDDQPLRFVAQLNFSDLWNNSLLFRASGLPSKGWFYVFCDWENDVAQDISFFYDSPTTDPKLHLKKMKKPPEELEDPCSSVPLKLSKISPSTNNTSYYDELGMPDIPLTRILGFPHTVQDCDIAPDQVLLFGYGFQFAYMDFADSAFWVTAKRKKGGKEVDLNKIQCNFDC
eukprot:TRINITY_DN454_c0_g1_i1.p1 TRINITY_DN454_c0_g1~~TRINITY_DN454_c0_g1_i1.p1  ORF type:complete len:529 (+),score=176.96 TRINITY_DN454_c0_g1_i1:173-1759(+)